ncbi:MAG: dockerin type I domain-containing protein [Planctomycetota bacterium]
MRLSRFAAGIAALCTSAAFGQNVTVNVTGPATANPGDTVTVTVSATVDSLPGGAIGGYGLDVAATANPGAVSGFAAAVSPTLTLGTVAGTPGAGVLDRVIGGQLSNVFNLNPSIDTSTTLTLFTTDVTIDAGATPGTTITIDVSPTAAGGGVYLYPDTTAGASVLAPTDGGTSLTTVALDILVPVACNGDIDGDGSTNLSDFTILAQNFGATGLPSGNGESRGVGDLNDDGSVNLADFTILANDFGCTP